MTLVNVTLFIVLAGFFLTREDDLPTSRASRGRPRAHHWRRRLAHGRRARRGPGTAGHP